ncbi:MAG TPA: VC0807 family protein [Stackebrandtia sp.]|jgi:hypothetical protein|uniref:VC0807 family protein n=1 Tax=Stackebrandtia sp. TaxID=2023065 RepID=UPI002D3535EA|nr:VC0807 family protein [Stackebrandtia sp.]HZE38237.1 VC0807 family protein [Stackebrandtia sp.]
MTTPTTAPPRASMGSRMTGFLILGVFDIGLSIVTFQIASANGASDQTAYLLASIGPLLGMLVTWLRSRTLSAASVIILIFNLLSAAATVIGGADSRLLIVKDSVVTAGFGLVCLVSLLLPKPLMFHFGLRFATDGSRDGIAYWNSLWQFPAFRRTNYLITVMWGVGFLFEAAIRIAAAYTMAFHTAYIVSQVLPFVVLALLIGATMWMGVRSRRRGEERARLAAENAEAVAS